MQRLGIVEGLLHTVARRVGVVLGFNQGNGEIGLVVQDVIGPLGLAPADQLAAHDNAACGEADLAANLRCLVPAGLVQGRGNELGAHVAFAEACLLHNRLTPCRK